MKTVFTSHEIAHVWAHKSAPRGKSPSNLSFDGDVILSYGTALAKHIEHKGKPAVIYNATSYSVSTSKAQGRVRSAIPSGIPVFRVEGQPMGSRLSFTGKELFEHYVERAAGFEAQASAARMQKSKDKLHAMAGMHLESAKAVAEFFGINRKVDKKAIARFAKAKAAELKKAKLAEEKRQAEYRAENVRKYDAWKAGDPAITLWSFDARAFPVAFRIEGDELVSSQGARVPLREARIAYRFATSKRGQEWRENGETCPVGSYRLNAINAQGIVAGCHRISWEEIERLAPVLA